MFRFGRPFLRPEFAKVFSFPQLAPAGGFFEGPLMMSQLPGEPPGPPSGGFGGPGTGGPDLEPDDDMDFQKGNKGKLIAVGALMIALGAGVFFLSQGKEGDTRDLTVQQAGSEMKNIFVLPKKEQLAAWRKWAAAAGDSGGVTEIKQEAVKQLAWARDPEGVKLAIELLKSPKPKLQSIAATALSHYGSPAADAAKPVLLEALKTAGPGSKPQVGWALVVLGESAAFEDVLALYRAGHIVSVQRLGGGSAFDPNKIVDMVSIDQVAGLAGDKSGAIRQLVATVLSRDAEPKYTDTLIQLLADKDEDVARQAAAGLGKIGDEQAREPLIAKLADADKESREKYLDALRKGVGGKGLVTALYAFRNDPDPKNRWYRKKQIFKMIDELNDPRAADELATYLGVEEHVHYKYRTARALAQIGDLRGLPFLAKRMRMDPEKIYSDQYDWEQLLKRDGKERVEAARLIADLARLHPEKHEEMRATAERAIIRWNHERPAPHANGLRALANMKSTRDIKQMRAWANPKAKMPKQGQQPPMPQEWVIAQSALRYIGSLEDEPSWKVLLEMLKKKPETLSVAQASLNAGGLAILGMSLNAVGKGASDGLSEWGDPKGFEPLLAFIEDSKQNENSRESACAALAWTADAESMGTVAQKISEYSGASQQEGFIRKCLLETLVQRPIPGTAAAFMTLLNAEQPISVRNQVARAMAKAGLNDELEEQLLELTKDDALITQAVLALILGGKPETAARAIAIYGDKPKEALEELHDLWFKTFGYWSSADVETGVLFRYIDNAVAMSRVEVKQTPQQWAKVLLERRLASLIFDNGPHSFTRVELRSLLFKMAKGDDAEKAAGAVRALQFLDELGVLMALRDVDGDVAKLAEQAVFELNNPKLGVRVELPDSAR